MEEVLSRNGNLP